MNTFERAFAYITRKKTRTLIILLILSVVTSSIYACFSILSASKNLESRISKSANSSFSIVKNPASNGIKIDDIKKIAKQNNIKSLNCKHTTNAKLKSGKVVETDQKIQVDQTDENFKNLVKLHAVANSNKENPFISEAFKLVSGTHITESENQNKILIHEKLAEKNHLKVGEKINLSVLKTETSHQPQTLQTQNKSSETPEETFTISGIFSGKIPEDFNGLSSDFSENTVYASFNKNHQIADSATFFPEDPEKINETIANIKKSQLDWKNLDIIKNTKAFENIISSIKTMKGIIGVMTSGIIIAGIAALSLVLILWLRERVYEIGILLSIGHQKRQIIGQFILELVIVSVPTIIIALIFGNLLSSQLLDGLLAGEELNKLSGSLSSSTNNILGSVITLLFSYATLLAIIATSVVITTFSILVQKPKKILSKIS